MRDVLTILPSPRPRSDHSCHHTRVICSGIILQVGTYIGIVIQHPNPSFSLSNYPFGPQTTAPDYRTSGYHCEPGPISSSDMKRERKHYNAHLMFHGPSPTAIHFPVILPNLRLLGSRKLNDPIIPGIAGNDRVVHKNYTPGGGG